MIFSRQSRSLSILSSVLLFGVVVLALPGCGKGGSGGGSTSVAGGNILRYPLQTEPTNLDPARVEDGDTIDLIQNIFEGLVKWSDENTIVPNIAEKWDISSDGKVYTFHLHDNVKFHNGRILVAKDFVYSITRPLLPDTKSGTAMTYLNDILGAKDVSDGKTTELKGVKALDDKTLQITLDNRRPYFLGKMTMPTSYAVCKEAIEANGNKLDEKAMIGTGPFKVDSYVSGSVVKLSGFKQYHDGAPILDGIERPIMKDSFTRQTAYESGALDYTDVQRADVDRIQKDPKLSKELKVLPRANVWYLAMSQQAFEPFKKKEVRQAFAYAINKDELIRLVYKGTATRANGIVPPGVPGANEKFQGLDYNVQKAQELMAKAGYPGGKGFPKLTITYRQGYQYVADGVQQIRSDLKKNLGIDVDTKESEWAKMLDDRKKGTLECFHIRWSADYLDPQDFLSMMLRTGVEENKIGYSNPKFDALCDAADVEPNADKRKAMYIEAEKIVVEDAPWVTLFYLPDVELQKPYVTGLRASLFGHLPHTKASVKH